MAGLPPAPIGRVLHPGALRRQTAQERGRGGMAAVADVLCAEWPAEAMSCSRRACGCGEPEPLALGTVTPVPVGASLLDAERNFDHMGVVKTGGSGKVAALCY